MSIEQLGLAKETAQELTIEELNELSKFIQEVIIVKKEEALEKALEPLQNLASSLGIPVSELLNKKTKRKSKDELVVKYRDTTNPENVWSGRGQRPRWIKEALANGHTLDDFLV